jgi:hypothetical protein
MEGRTEISSQRRLPMPFGRIAASVRHRRDCWWPVLVAQVSRLIGRPHAVVRNVGVSCGQLFNLDVELPQTWGDAPATLELVLTRGAVVHAVPMDAYGGGEADGLRSDDRTGMAGRAAARLGDATGGLPLADGAWSLSVRRSVGASRKVIAVAARPGHRDRRPGPVTSCPVTGRRYQLSTTPAGLAQLIVYPPLPSAEVTAVNRTWTGMSITGRLIGVAEGTTVTAAVISAVPPTVPQDASAAESSSGLTADVVSAGRTAEVPVVIELTAGCRFRIELPVLAMAPAAGEPPQVWQLHVQPAQSLRLAAGRFLHDLEAPQSIFKLPRHAVLVEGNWIGLAPHFTAAGDLAVACENPSTGMRESL